MPPNLTHVVRSPRLSQVFTVNRRAETVDNTGTVNIAVTQSQARGVISAGSKNDLEVGADQQSMTKSISVVTQFRLQGPSPGFQPDVITWRGDNFKVTRVEDYSSYGEGWVQAEAESYDWVDQPPQV